MVSSYVVLDTKPVSAQTTVTQIVTEHSSWAIKKSEQAIQKNHAPVAITTGILSVLFIVTEKE